MQVLEIVCPFLYEIGRYILQVHTKEVVHLGGEDSQCDTCGEANDYGVWHKLDDIAQLEQSHQYEQYARHDSGDEQSRDAMLLNHAIDNHDKRSCRTANLHFAATESRDDKSRDDGCY